MIVPGQLGVFHSQLCKAVIKSQITTIIRLGEGLLKIYGSRVGVYLRGGSFKEGQFDDLRYMKACSWMSRITGLAMAKWKWSIVSKSY